MVKLYELTEDYRELEAMLEAGDIDEKAFADTLEGISGEISEKMEAMKKLKATIDGELAGIDLEIERLNKLKKSKESAINSLESYAFSQMKKMGVSKVSTTIGDIKIQKGRQSVQVDIDAMDAVNAIRFVKTKITSSADKAAIKKALVAGEQIAGASLIVGEDKIKL